MTGQPRCLVTKKLKLKLRKNRLLKSGLKTLVGWIVRASETAKEFGHLLVFGTFSNNVLGSSKAIRKAFSWIWEHIKLTVLFLLYLLLLVLCSKISQCMCILHLKLQLFILDLSSKVPAGVIVRRLKYPYMEICELGPNKLQLTIRTWQLATEMERTQLLGLMLEWLQHLSAVSPCFKYIFKKNIITQS